MGAERYVKLFKNGRSQAVGIPREFERAGEDAIIRNEDRKLVIEPSPLPSLLALLATLRPIPEAFGQMDDAAPELVEL